MTPLDIVKKTAEDSHGFTLPGWEPERLAELEKQRQDDQDRVQYIRALKRVISRELDFSEGFTVGLVDALLDHMEVMGTEDKKVVHVTVYLKGMPEQQNYVVQRAKGKTSVCTRAYT